MRKGTVCFIQNGDTLLLALIEYSPTDRKWTGIGGFVEEGESLEEAVVREANEETYITLDKNHLTKVAELNGSFQLNVFITDMWSGEFKAKEASIKDLQWFHIDQLPYYQMHPGTEAWLSKVLAGKKVKITDGQTEMITTFE